ncbi:hypothetical protein ABZS63_41545, partial [Streptomyces sp. NPDC005568]
MTHARIDHLVTSGTFSLDGGTWEVDNNVWIIGDDHEAIVIVHHPTDSIPDLPFSSRCHIPGPRTGPSHGP